MQVGNLKSVDVKFDYDGEKLTVQKKVVSPDSLEKKKMPNRTMSVAFLKPADMIETSDEVIPRTGSSPALHPLVCHSSCPTIRPSVRP